MRLSTYILSLALFFTLVQCGGEDALSKNVDLAITPNKPIIQNSDVIVPIGSGDSTLTIAAPFTSFGITLSNNSGESLVITGFRLETSYDSTNEKTGAMTTETGSSDVSPASLASQELVVKSSPSCTFAASNCNQNVLAILPTGTNNYAVQAYDSTGTSLANIKFIFSSLPKNDNKNFTYRMKLSILGYFGTETTINSRVNKSIYFTTF